MARKPSKGRIPRAPKHCTMCGEPLPKYRNHWGLVWDDKETGCCKTCLITTRIAIGYYGDEKPPPLPRKRKRDQGSS